VGVMSPRDAMLPPGVPNGFWPGVGGMLSTTSTLGIGSDSDELDASVDDAVDGGFGALDWAEGAMSGNAGGGRRTRRRRRRRWERLSKLQASRKGF
jgi:hypothetical protein